MRNPFEVLCFTKDLVKQFRGVLGGPDALLKIAEAHRKYLLIRWHPDRAIGGTEKAAEITQAFEEIRDMTRREEYIEQFLAPTPDSLSRQFFREDLKMAEKRIADLERQWQKIERESAGEISALKKSRALFAQKLVDVCRRILFPAFSSNSMEAEDFLQLSELPETFIAVTRQTPMSHYATLFSVHSRTVVFNTHRIRTIKGGEKDGREHIVSVGTAVEELKRAFSSGILRKERSSVILGTTSLEDWGTQTRTPRDEVVVPAQLLSEYLLKIENGIRIGSIFLTGSCKQKKRRGMDPDEYVFSFNGYLESIHSF